MKVLPHLFLLLLSPLALAAQGYKIVHPDGTVEFTDQPVKNSEEINLPAAQGYKSAAETASPGKGTSDANSKKKENADYLQFSITSPTAEETIPNTGGTIPVSVNVSPALHQGDQVVITLDGGEAAKGESTTFTLSDVTRGAHLLGASIVDSSGTAIRQADPVTFYVFQQSRLNPNNPINRNRR